MKTIPTMTIRGVEGRRIRHIRTLQVVPLDKDTVVPANDSYWLRKVRDGDVVRVDQRDAQKTKGTKSKE